MRLASVLLLPHLLTLGVAVDPNEATMEEMRAQAFAHAKRVEQGLEPPSKVDERAMGDSAALRGVERMYGGGAGAGRRSAYPPEDAGRDVSDAEGDYWRNLGMNMGKNAGKKKALEGAEQITAAEKCMACHASVVELERLIASRWRAGRRPGVVELTDYLEELCDLDRFTGKGYTLQEAPDQRLQGRRQRPLVRRRRDRGGAPRGRRRRARRPDALGAAAQGLQAVVPGPSRPVDRRVRPRRGVRRRSARRSRGDEDEDGWCGSAELERRRQEEGGGEEAQGQGGALEVTA